MPNWPNKSIGGRFTAALSIVVPALAIASLSTGLWLQHLEEALDGAALVALPTEQLIVEEGPHLFDSNRWEEVNEAARLGQQKQLERNEQLSLGMPSGCLSNLDEQMESCVDGLQANEATQTEGMSEAGP